MNRFNSMVLTLVVPLAAILAEPSGAQDGLPPNACGYVEETDAGYLELRAGPGAEHPILTRLYASDFLYFDYDYDINTGKQTIIEKSGWLKVSMTSRMENRGAVLSDAWVNARHIERGDCTGNQVQATSTRFVFGDNRVCSAENESACVALGSPSTFGSLEAALPGFVIAYADDCEGQCYSASATHVPALTIRGVNGKVAHIESRFDAFDANGTTIGHSLRDAVGGSSAYCSHRDSLECWNEGGVRYLVREGCDIDASEDESLRVAIPECAVVEGLVLGNRQELSDEEPEVPYAPAFEKYPAVERYTGQTRFPDFKGRDKAYRSSRTRIRDGLEEQVIANFAGKYNLVPLLQTGGAAFAVVDSASGRVLWLGGIGSGPYYDFAYRADSNLLVFQWSSGMSCHVIEHAWTGAHMLQLGNVIDRMTDEEGHCVDSLTMPHDGPYAAIAANTKRAEIIANRHTTDDAKGAAATACGGPEEDAADPCLAITAAPNDYYFAALTCGGFPYTGASKQSCKHAVQQAQKSARKNTKTKCLLLACGQGVTDR